MPNVAAKTASNVFYQARCKASTHNDQLSSREGAADLMSIDRGRLYRIESGVAAPYPEEVHMMADLYNAPELRNYYCTETCPLGVCYEKAGVASLDRITVMAMGTLERAEETRQRLLKIAEDGKVTGEEREEMMAVVSELGEMERLAQSLKMWVAKNLPEEK